MKIQVNSVYVRKFVIKSSQIKGIINVQKLTLHKINMKGNFYEGFG
jgi:hypothetical protein